MPMSRAADIVVSAEVVEHDTLIRRCAERAAATLVESWGRSPACDGSGTLRPVRLRLVGVHGLEAVAACPLLARGRPAPDSARLCRSAKVHPSSPRTASRCTASAAPGVCGSTGTVFEQTVVYTLRDRLTAEMHLVHGCAVAAAVLWPGERQDELELLSWPTRLAAFGLTVREVDVLALLLARFTDHEVAERLVVSRTTVRAHVRALQRKLGVAGRRDLWRRFADDLPRR